MLELQASVQVLAITPTNQEPEPRWTSVLRLSVLILIQ